MSVCKNSASIQSRTRPPKFATKDLLITITTAGSLDYGPESVVSVAPETAAAGATAASSIEIAMIDFSS